MHELLFVPVYLYAVRVLLASPSSKAERQGAGSVDVVIVTIPAAAPAGLLGNFGPLLSCRLLFGLAGLWGHRNADASNKCRTIHLQLHNFCSSYVYADQNMPHMKFLPGQVHNGEHTVTSSWPW